MTKEQSKINVRPLGLCAWVLPYAFRRWQQLLVVLITMFLRIGLDVLKPWPLAFLVDYVLKAIPKPPALARFVALLPGPTNPTHLIGWCVSAIVLIFLFSGALGLLTSYTNISLGQRMVYDLAADLFAHLQKLSLRF